MSYAVYINRTRKRASWHRESCGHIKKHGGTAEQADQELLDCDTADQARALIKAKTVGFSPGNVGPCRVCRPDAEP